MRHKILWRIGVGKTLRQKTIHKSSRKCKTVPAKECAKEFFGRKAGPAFETFVKNSLAHSLAHSFAYLIWVCGR